MTIKIEYDIDEIVYIMHKNQICKGNVTGFSIVKSNNLCDWGNKEQYTINILPIAQQHVSSKDKMFRTKEDLLATL